MKLRIKGNCLRLRTSRSEVTRLLEGDNLEEVIRFAPAANAKLSYSLRVDSSIDSLTVQYEGNSLSLLMPFSQAKTWGLTDQVEIAENINLGEFGLLEVLIEKDFACLDRSDEENRDTFPNPNAGTKC